MAERDTIIHTVIDQTDDWIQVADSKWLPKKFMVQIDTAKPCVLQSLCDTLKTSKVTEVNFSSCGLGSLALTFVSEYVRDATAALTVLDVRWNKALDEAALAELRAAAPKTCKILTD